jgi:hypothetical protein
MTRPRGEGSRWRIGRVSLYQHHGCWWLYYIDVDGRKVRRHAGESGALAEVRASLLNARLVACVGGYRLPAGEL